MAVTYQLLEEFTGTRTNEMPDPENEGQTITTESACRDIKVRFTSDDDTPVVHERSVNVCFDGDGVYDADATAARVVEVGLGVSHKIAAGVINNPA